MNNHFIKYQSLGNDFIIFDTYKNPDTSIMKDENWEQFVQTISRRHFGIGSDGVLVLGKSTDGVPEIFIYNTDGSTAELCLNGLRCIAHYLHATHNFAQTFSIRMGGRMIACEIIESEKSLEIITNIGPTIYEGKKSITITLPKGERHLQRTFIGHTALVSNPHLIIFEQTSIEWLAEHGHLFERHPAFPHKTNTEFVWQDPAESSTFHVVVFERGVGITLSCSSGAAAVISTLFATKKIAKNEKIQLKMPGGIVSGLIDNTENIILSAQAEMIFEGKWHERQHFPHLTKNQESKTCPDQGSFQKIVAI